MFVTIYGFDVDYKFENCTGKRERDVCNIYLYVCVVNFFTIIVAFIEAFLLPQQFVVIWIMKCVEEKRIKLKMEKIGKEKTLKQNKIKKEKQSKS